MLIKHYVSPNELLEDSFELGAQVIKSGFIPDMIIGVWRGGAPIAISIHELFKYAGHNIQHNSIKTSSYEKYDRTNVVVSGIANIPFAVNSILLIDDIFDSGKSVEAVCTEIPNIDVRVATVWYKPKNNQTSLTPDYFVHKTNDWVVFPHELNELSQTDIFSNKSQKIVDVIKNLN